MRLTPLVLLFSLLAALPVFSQALSTSNQYVSARVESMSGLVTISAISPNAPLTGAQKSFLYVMVGDRIFTNNNVGVNIQTDPRFGGLLLDGANQKIGDTLRTTWANKQGCDIIQDVYPVKLTASGQIVIKWKVKNNSPNTAIWGQAQFLLDIHGQSTDAAGVLTRYGYRPIWEQYNSASTYGIPPLYASFEFKLPNAPTYETGTVGVGYTHDVNYSLGLKKPAQLTVGDWGAPLSAALVDILWGISGSTPWGSSYQDAAVMLQWDGIGVKGNETREIARTSYGTSEHRTCDTDPFLNVVFYPRHFDQDGAGYEPDTGVIEYYAFNKYSPIPSDPNYGPPTAETHITLQAGPNIRILSPTADNIEQTEQRQLLGPAQGYIPQFGVGTAFWTIIADRATGCMGKFDSWLKFLGDAKWHGSTQFVDTCTQELTIDCISEDILPPLVSNLTSTTSAPYRKSFDVSDNRVLDTGIDTITWIPQPGSNTDTSKFNVDITTFTPCTKSPQLARVTQLDSAAAGCFDFTIIDCAGNSALYTVCLPYRIGDPTPDTNAPIITIIGSYPGDTTPCRNLCDTIRITDNQEFDVGLESITMLSSLNMMVSVLPLQPGDSSHKAVICVTDSTIDGSLTIRAQDTVGNFTDMTFCYKALQAGVNGLPTETAPIELIGNPASSTTTLRITAAEEQTIKLSILDISGRVVTTRPVTPIPPGVTDVQIPLDELSAGTYYIVAEWGGTQYAKKLSVIK